MTDGCPSPSLLPVRTIIHWAGSILIPYFIKFSKSNLTPPIVSNRKPQLTRPVKFWKSELHENSESLGRWHLERYEKKNVFIFTNSQTI